MSPQSARRRAGTVGIRSANKRRSFIAWMCAVSCAPLVAFALQAQAGRPIGVADMIETARMQTGASLNVADGEDRRRIGEGVAMSPDGKRFASIVVRGDITSDRVIADVISARLDDLDSTARVKSVARLTGRFRGDTGPLIPFRRMFEWVDNESIALRWEDANGEPQVFRVHLGSGEVEQITQHLSGVKFFAMTPNGTVVYSASPESVLPSRNLLEEGGLVRAHDAFSLADGDLDGAGLRAETWNREWFVQHPGRPPQRFSIDGQARQLNQTYALSFSPDGHWLVMPGTPASIPPSWDAYAEGFIASAIAEERRIPRSGSLARQLTQLYLIDLTTGSSRVVLPAPTPLSSRTNVVWASDSRSFLVGPTYLLPPTDTQGLRGHALVEIDVMSRQTRRIPVPDVEATWEVWDRLAWAAPDLIVMEHRGVRAAARRTRAGWQTTKPPPDAAPPSNGDIRVEVRQDANTPPRLFAINTRSGEERMVFDPNPGLALRFSLGRVERFRWQDSAGRTWSGMLYRPVGYESGRRYPLVIQTHGHAAPNEFSLNGMGGSYPTLGVGISIYAAQPLAGRGMWVLQMEDQNFNSGPEEARAYMHAYEAAVAQLDGQGLVDPSRVGISGFSRTGWHVLFALTHSEFEFSAALVSDNIDGGYFLGTLMPGSFYYENGAQPYGAGLENWLEVAPGFALDRVRTPLRLQTEGAVNTPYLLAAWETFARLRNLSRPVEYYVVPDVLNGNHLLQNPKQAFASQQGAVEWFDYWLNGTEPETATAERRSDLHRLRSLRDAAYAAPRAPLLEWSARPRDAHSKGAEQDQGK